MKHTTLDLIRALLIIGACAVLTSTYARAAEDGGALYKKRCAGCHGAHGEGKPAMKGPSLKATQSATNEITERLAKGHAGSMAPHNKGISGLTAEQTRAIAAYVKTL